MMAQRFGLPPRSKRIACVLLLSGFFGCLAADGRAAGIECPEVGPGMVPNLLAHFKQPQLVASGNSVDLANEIYDVINRLQIERPNISYTELTNVLIAAYCPLVVTAPQLTAAEKWQRMRLIIANVPLPPAVYRELRSQAAAVDQTPAQFMATILAKAAGR